MAIYRCFFKRTLDIIAASTGLVAMLPLFLVVGMLVRLRLGSPIFFSQMRSGRDGKIFRLWKFRTMTNERNGSGQLLPDEQRLPPIGVWLRATSLDELPGLWNVLRGDMSLVGPRPLVSEYFAHYDATQRRRHEVRPGITGLAQVNGRNALSWHEKFAYDVDYVNRYSLALDLWILCRTVGKVLFREGISMAGEATTAPFVPNAIAPWPVFDEEQIGAVERVLRSGQVNYWTGNEVRLFEKEYAASIGVRHAIAVANGTVALELALTSLGIGFGDEVIVPSRTFIASASAVVMQGATPVIADIHPDSQTLTAAAIEAVITPRTRAIIAVHLGGWPCDMEPILDLASRHGLFVIEDCAQAHGAMYRGRPVGSIGHVNAFSFCQDKILTTGGEGGMLTTNDNLAWEKAWKYKDHGKNRRLASTPSSNGNYRFLHDSFGTNFRMTEMQAAIGRIQLTRLPQWVDRRRSRAARIVAGLADVPGIRFPMPGPDFYHSYYRLYGFIDREALRPGWTRDEIIRVASTKGAPIGCGSCGEIYREKAFANIAPPTRLPIASYLHETSLAFPVHPTLDDTAIDALTDTVRGVLENAFRKDSELDTSRKSCAA